MSRIEHPRRSAPAALLLLLLSAGLPASAQDPPPPARCTAGPLVSADGAGAVRLWLQTDREASVRFELAVEGGAGADARVELEPVRTDAAADHTCTVAARLAPGTTYRYSARVDGVPVAGGPWRFRTPPAPGEGRVRIAFGSCVHQGRFPEQPIFGVIAAAAPDAFVFLGDNSYFVGDDWRRPEAMWARVRAQRQCPDLAPLLATVPILAQWDDHDYGPNNSDRRFPLRDVAREVFRAYWPNPGHGEEDEGIYTRATLGPVELFLLDDRWFRDPNTDDDTPEKTVLGARQRAWLVEGLAASAAPIKLVATGQQFLARYHPFESWDLATNERQALLEELAARGVRGVVFISGDRHLGEALCWRESPLDYPLYEVTSSPLANLVFLGGDALESADRLFIYTRGMNFGWIEVDPQARSVKLELRDHQGKTLWEREVGEELLPPP